jgi:hypothetical protein
LVQANGALIEPNSRHLLCETAVLLWEIDSKRVLVHRVESYFRYE